MIQLPEPGETIEIRSYKHDGRIHRIWKETTVLQSSKQQLIGGNFQTEVVEPDGKIWKTNEPAICYFHSEYWFNIIGMIQEETVYYYCNLSSPFVFENGILKYIDYDLDFKVFPDLSYEILDGEEYELHRKEMNYPENIEKNVQQHVAILTSWIKEKKGPFSPGFIEKWYQRYRRYQ